MKTAKRMMMVFAVMVMMVMVLPSTSAEAVKVTGLNEERVDIVIHDGENDKISKKLSKYTLKLKGVSKSTAKKAKWSSSNKKVATVNQKGVVKGKKMGSATITCKINGQSYKCFVGVIDAATPNKLRKSLKYSHGAETVATTSVSQYALQEYADGRITKEEFESKKKNTSMMDYGVKVKVRNYYYFSYRDNYQWLKKYFGIKEGRLKSKNIWAKCNQDPEYKKRVAEEKAKEDEEAAKAIREGKARDEAIAKEIAEAQAKAEAEAKAKAEAEAKAKEDAIKEAEANGGTVITDEDGNIIAIIY